MTTAIQQKIERLKARYTDDTLPMEARHVIEVLEDLNAAVFDLAQKVEQLKKEVG
jgi:hypothetical protein